MKVFRFKLFTWIRQLRWHLRPLNSTSRHKCAVLHLKGTSRAEFVFPTDCLTFNIQWEQLWQSGSMRQSKKSKMAEFTRATVRSLANSFLPP